MSKDTRSAGANSTGRDNRKVFVDAVEQALVKREQARAAGRYERKPRRSNRTLVDILRRRMFHAEKLAREQHNTLAAIIETRKKGAENVETPRTLDAAFVAAFTQHTTSQVNLAEQIRRCVESERKTVEGLEGEDLDAVLRSHLPRLATGMTEGDQRAMLETWFGKDVTDVLLAGPRSVQ